MLRQIMKTFVNKGSINLRKSLLIRHLSLINASANFKNETIELHVQKDESSKAAKHEFPFVWLRDNCKCSECFHKTSSSRIINWEAFDVAVKPKSVEYDNERKLLKIIWNDNDEHESEFAYDWLEARNFSNRGDHLRKFYSLPKKLWSKNEFRSAMEYFDFEQILSSDLELYKWLRSFAINGVATITGVPETEGEARKIADRVGFIRKTHYGEEFMVKAKDGTSNVAYLSANLQMHTDLPYYEYVPGVNLLHCLVQSKSNGAQNLLVDGFYIAEKLRREHPKEFEMLTKVVVNWSDVGEEDANPFHSIYRAPMICTDYDGNLTRINHSIPQRDSFFSVPLEQVKDWYKALDLFVKTIHEEAVELKTAEGTILCFDNRRAIHGRKTYEDTEGNCRHIVGAYLDWDEIYSRLRVLQKKFDRDLKYVV